jgi:hypothetical protein
VGVGDSIGMHLSLWEVDPAGWSWGGDTNDEVGFAMPLFDWAYLREHAGQTLNFAAPMGSEEGWYAVHYTLTIGQLTTQPVAATGFAKVSYPAWARTYDLHVAGKTHKVTLSYTPANKVKKGTWAPFGALTSTGAVPIHTHRLWGNYWEFYADLPVGKRRFVGYLAGDPASPVITGTTYTSERWLDDGPSGFFMTPSP